MKSALAAALALFAMTFCGLGDKLKDISGGSSSNSNSSTTGSSKTGSNDATAEKPTLTSSQQAIQDASNETKWDDQGISWKLPVGWPKMQVMKESFNYGSPANGFLIASISVMPDSFPADVSIKATYDAALEQLKQGKYEKVRWLELDGVKALSGSNQFLRRKTGSGDISGSLSANIRTKPTVEHHHFNKRK